MDGSHLTHVADFARRPANLAAMQNVPAQILPRAMLFPAREILPRCLDCAFDSSFKANTSFLERLQPRHDRSVLAGIGVWMSGRSFRHLADVATKSLVEATGAVIQPLVYGVLAEKLVDGIGKPLDATSWQSVRGGKHLQRSLNTLPLLLEPA
jgi:hypothetical protein